MNLGAIGDLFKSEKGLAVGVLVLAASVLAYLGKMTVEQWMEYTQFMAVTYVAGKTVQGGVTTLAKRKEAQLQTATPAADPARAPTEAAPAGGE